MHAFVVGRLLVLLDGQGLMVVPLDLYPGGFSSI